MNDDNVLIANIDDFKIESSEKENVDEKDECPECRGEEKFQHHEMKPSPFKDRKFFLDK